MKEITGELNGTGMRLAFVVSRFNAIFTEQLLRGAHDAATRHGVKEEDLVVVRVPGANEIPLMAAKLAESKKFHAIVALGAVIDGATDHAMLINTSVARALAGIALKTGVPVLNGIVCAHNLDQAIERSGSKAGNKGFDTTVTAIETVNVLNQL